MKLSPSPVPWTQLNMLCPVQPHLPSVSPLPPWQLLPGSRSRALCRCCRSLWVGSQAGVQGGSGRQSSVTSSLPQPTLPGSLGKLMHTVALLPLLHQRL